jgi:hypothetical protein
MDAKRSVRLVLRPARFHTCLMARSRNEFLDAKRVGSPPPPRCCDQPGCAAAGEFRAPRSRDRLGELSSYHWFCLEHVRLYNASWDYYAGMNDREIERELRSSLVGDRPTWPLGRRVAGAHWRDPLRVFGDQAEDLKKRGKKPSQEDDALVVFELRPPFSLTDLKSRYKALVKLHHPDVHGGSKDAEERLKTITLAYALLKTRYFG